jgi:protein TonB
VFVKGKTPVPAGGTGTFFEFQVTKQAKAKSDSPQPRYPDELRATNVEGEVLAQFVVDEDGRVNPETLKILKTSHDLFTEAVRKALPTMQFDAAQSNGRNVKQLLQMPFTFNLSK